ncbi:MAG: P22 coat - protein 5 family protein, partial [Candidatus Marinimicrobia bacterium]|nr:P22 coat - protein 5 family protein [Candidatus Neomarinimicrobiota bacterium]
MANVLTNLANDIMIAADQVGREAVGFIPSVTINSGSEEAAQGDTVRSFVTPAATVNTSATPSMTIPEGDDQTVTTKTMALDQIASVRIPWTGEDIKHVNNGSGFETVYGDQIKQAMKGITNSIESHIATIAYQGASRAVGTAGTTPFSSNHDTVAEARQIIFDNGIPVDDNRLSLILNSNAGTNLRNLAVLQKANESGNDSLLRQGTLLDLQGAMVKESGQVVSHTKGTGASYIVNDASSAIGDTTIATDTGSGTILAGDIVTFNADT